MDAHLTCSQRSSGSSDCATGDGADIQQCTSEQLGLWNILLTARKRDRTGIQQCTSEQLGLRYILVTAPSRNIPGIQQCTSE